MTKHDILKLVLCAGAAMSLSACSSTGHLGSGFALGGSGQGAALPDDDDTPTGSGNAGNGGGGTTGGGATNPGGSAGAPSGGGGGGQSMNGGGNTASQSNTGAIIRVAEVLTDTTGNLLAVTGNAVLLGAGSLGTTLTDTGHALIVHDLAALPVVGDAADASARAADGLLNPVAKVALANQTLIGSGTASSAQLVGVGVFSTTAVSGQVAAVNLAPAATAGTVQLASISLGGSQVLGGAGPALVSANVLPVGTGAPSNGLPAIGVVTQTVSAVLPGLTGGSFALGAGAGAGAGATLGPVTGVVAAVGGLSVLGRP